MWDRLPRCPDAPPQLEDAMTLSVTDGGREIGVRGRKMEIER